MNWNDVALFTQRFLFCMTTTTVAGSAFVLVVLILEKIPSFKNSCLHLAWLKMTTLLYLLPIVSALVMVLRMDFFERGWYG